MKALAILKKKHNDKTGKSEWALVSRKSGRVLRWFGAQHPSDERVHKEEQRIQYFKHHGSYPSIARVLSIKKKAAPKDQDLHDALRFMKESGLVPTGKGPLTKPSLTPSFNVVWDGAEQIYYLITDYDNGTGEMWSITPTGDSEYIGEVKGEFHPTKNQTVWTDGEFADYVELPVIQEIYGLLDPDFEKDEQTGLASVRAAGFQPPTKAEILDVLRKHPLIKLKEKVKRAFLVGSFAGGNPHDESDVDILLEVEPHPDQSALQLAEAYRRPLQQYFVTHNIRGRDDSVHPQWAGRRVDLYFTYDADQEDDRPKQELASLKEGNRMVLNKRKYPSLARVLAAPIDIENPRKNFGRAKEVAEKKIDEVKALVRKDLEDFARDYMQANFRKANDKDGKDKDEYRFDQDRKKEIRNVTKLYVEDTPGKPAQPKEPKGHDEGSVTLFAKNKTLAPGVDHESGGDNEDKGYDRNKAVWVRIGFSWEETEDPETPKVFWWEGTPAIIRDPAKEEYMVKRKHEYKDYAEIEKYMNKRLNTDEIIRDTSEQHLAQIKARMAPVVDQVRQILKPLTEKPVRFANYPTPIKPELIESEALKGEDQSFYFKVMADPKKNGYEPFQILYVSLTIGGGEFHTPYDLSHAQFDQYFNSHFELKGWDENDDNLYSPVDAPNLEKLKELVREVQQKERQVPVLEVDEDKIDQEPKQLEAPEEESA